MMWLTTLYLCLVSFTFVKTEFPLTRSTVAQSRENDEVDYRLPGNIRPIDYTITLEPDFETFNFSGNVEINVTVVNSTNTLVLHSLEQTIDEVLVFCQSSEGGAEVQQQVVNSTLDSVREFLIIEVNQELQAGTQCRITILYVGYLNPDNNGFYRANYIDEEGNIRWLATTQFQPTSARKAFPCFDEPALKAQFEVIIIRPKDYIALSNMPLRETQEYGDKEIDYFEKSVTMSTYLVAFVVSDFAYISEGIQAVYARKQLIDDGRAEFALEVGLAILDGIEEFVQLHYTSEMPKLDNVAIPDDWFSAGAMENWGLVTYREMFLLHKEGITTSSEKQFIAIIIAHEYGHKWCGNLVSPLWWSYLWINEGFATYFEYYGASVAQPTWRLMERFVLTSVQLAFASDALETTRPMTFDAGSPSEVLALFDRIAYDKAASVLRMLEHFLTTPVFKDGLNRFLQTKAYDAASEYDLWNAFQQAANERLDSEIPYLIETIMLSWTNQAGFPVVNVEVDAAAQGITFSQERFLLHNASHNLDQVWYIPINYATSSNPDFTGTSAQLWLTEASQTFSVSNSISQNDWIIVNKQQTGYYRVNYAEENWKLITDYLKSDDFEKIHPLNRAQLVDDALNLARSGRLDYHIALNLISYLKRETDYMPLYSFVTALSFLDRVLASSDHRQEFREFAQELLQGAYEHLTAEESEDDEHVDRLNRLNILTTQCNLGHQNCQQQMLAHLRRWEHVSPDLQSPVYCGGLRGSSGEEEWNYLYDLYISNDTENLQRSRLLSSLGCTENESLLNRLHDMVFLRPTQWTLFRNADRLSAFAALYSNSDSGLRLALNSNFAEIFSSFTVGQVNTILNGISLRLTDSSQHAVFRRILEMQSNSIKATHQAAFRNALNNLEETTAWISSYQEHINEWLLSRDEEEPGEEQEEEEEEGEEGEEQEEDQEGEEDSDPDPTGGAEKLFNVLMYSLITCSIALILL